MYLATRNYGPLGPERLTTAAITGYRVAFRRAGYADSFKRARRQTLTVNRPSRFAALRELIRQSRIWWGRIYFLEVLSIEPVWRVEYTPECLMGEE